MACEYCVRRLASDSTICHVMCRMQVPTHSHYDTLRYLETCLPLYRGPSQNARTENRAAIVSSLGIPVQETLAGLNQITVVGHL